MQWGPPFCSRFTLYSWRIFSYMAQRGRAVRNNYYPLPHMCHIQRNRDGQKERRGEEWQGEKGDTVAKESKWTRVWNRRVVGAARGHIRRLVSVCSRTRPGIERKCRCKERERRMARKRGVRRGAIRVAWQMGARKTRVLGESAAGETGVIPMNRGGRERNTQVHVATQNGSSHSRNRRLECQFSVERETKTDG